MTTICVHHCSDYIVDAGVFDLQTPVIIGRAPHCDVIDEHPSLSREHVAITESDGKLWVTDLGGRNGTEVNHTRLEPYAPRELVGTSMIDVPGLVIVVNQDDDPSNSSPNLPSRSMIRQRLLRRKRRRRRRGSVRPVP